MRRAYPEGAASPVWIDLVEPTEEEKAAAEGFCGLRIPTLQDLSEIETSSRAYVEGGAIYLSTPMIAHAGSGDPQLTPVGFVLAADLLITVRFDKLSVFSAEAARAGPDLTATEAFTRLFEAIIDRDADLLEMAGAQLDRLSNEIFTEAPRAKRTKAHDPLRTILNGVGGAARRLSQIRDSLLGAGRVLPLVCERAHGWLSPEQATRLTVVRQDIASLDDYETHLSNKTQFLLDAVLGLINVEQNDIFKLLTVVSVVGIPPTLVASVYGMNFHFMPELSWRFGYPFGWALIIVSTLVPLGWFKWRGWF